MKVVKSKKENGNVAIEGIVDFLRESESEFSVRGGFMETNENISLLMEGKTTVIRVPLLKVLCKHLGIGTFIDGNNMTSKLEEVAEKIG